MLNWSNLFQIISINNFKELVKNHPDSLFINVTCMQDVNDLFQDFLNINDKGVSLKNICDMTNKKNIPLIYGMAGI